MACNLIRWSAKIKIINFFSNFYFTLHHSYVADDTADLAALQQIEEKGYAKPFANDPRKLFKIGVSFSTESRRIEDWKVIEEDKIRIFLSR